MHHAVSHDLWFTAVSSVLQQLPERNLRGNVSATDADPVAPRSRDHSSVSGKEFRALQRQRVFVRRTQRTVDQPPGQHGRRCVERAPAENHTHVQLRQNQEHGWAIARLRRATPRIHGGTRTTVRLLVNICCLINIISPLSIDCVLETEHVF